MEAWRLKMQSWWVLKPVVSGSHHPNEEQDPDPHYVKKWIRIREKLDPDPY
jgi:hypothetical protein